MVYAYKTSSGQQISIEKSIENPLEFGVFWSICLVRREEWLPFWEPPVFPRWTIKIEIGPFDSESFHGAMVIFGSLAQRSQKAGLKTKIRTGCLYAAFHSFWLVLLSIRDEYLPSLEKCLPPLFKWGKLIIFIHLITSFSRDFEWKSSFDSPNVIRSTWFL